MTLINVLAPYYTNARLYGAVGDGVTDDTAHLQAGLNALTSGGGLFLPQGTYLISSALTTAAQHTWLLGAGSGTVIKAASGFSGAEMLLIAHDLCGVSDVQFTGGPNTSSGSNPVTNGIEVSAARYATLRNLQMYYINGWAIESASGSSVNNAGGIIQNVHIEHCAQGIHLLGNLSANKVGQLFLNNVHPEIIDNGDGLLLEDINDILVSNFNGAVAGAAVTGSMIHVKGPCSSCLFTNIDVGANTSSTVSPAILVESDGNGDPSNIAFVNGVTQNALQGISVTGGSDIAFEQMRSKFNQTDGILVSTAGNVSLRECVFSSNNQSAATAYDIHVTQASNNTWINGGRCESQVGVSAGQVTNPVDDVNHKGYFFGVAFIGSGTTPSTVFASGGTPQIVRGCVGYNPRGAITAGTIGASPATVNTSQHDLMIVWLTNTANISSVTIGGTAISALPTSGTVWHVPARQSIVITYTSSAPTWQWFAD